MVKRKIIRIDENKCNGCGLCIPNCPEGALQIIDDKARLISDLFCDGLGACIGHCPQDAIIIEEREAEPFDDKVCPGARMMEFGVEEKEKEQDQGGERPSQLRQWPIQLHLVPPAAPYFLGRDVLLAADCVAYALGDFHKDYLKGKSLAIACPKLDEGQDIYIEKITALIDQANIKSLTVMIMEVPCCSGLLRLAQQAADKASRKIPIKEIIVGIQGV
jgi:ferredoxin